MARISPLLLLPPLVFAGIVAAFMLGMQRDDPDALPSALIGKEVAPVVSVALGDMPAFFDADLRDGKVKIVNFWASWCAPCRAEHPNLQLLADEGVTVLGVNYKDAPADALAFLADLGNPFAKLVADPNGRMAIDWGLYGVPESFVIDGQGKVILRFAGPITGRVLESEIRPALKKDAAGE
ncbi:MAG: DsbE family thiol:disulfide interchange protein [Albidovulum sp.]